MLFLAVIILITSLAIAGVAAYFSVIGLSLLFVGSGVSIIIMGTVLEVGKLITVSVLHQLWKDLGILLKTYLLLASFVLMLITSIGIYGYLSNGYNATNIKIAGLEAQKSQLVNKSLQLKNDNLKLSEPVVVVSNDKDLDINSFLQQQSDFILSKQASIKEIRQGIANYKSKSSEDLTAVKNLLDSEVNKELSQISLYNNRLQILDREIDTWLNQGTGGLFKQNGLEKARLVKEQQKGERDSIEQQIKQRNSNIEQLRTDYKTAVTNINNTLAENIKTSESNIAKLEQEIVYDKQIIVDAQNKQKEKQVQDVSNIEIEKTRKLNAIKENETQIAKINEQVTAIDTNINNTDVGTFKFVSKSVKMSLDDTVNIFILVIIFAFDPLAVALLLCFNHLVKPKRKQEKIIVESVKESEIELPKNDEIQSDVKVKKKEYPYTDIENNKIAYRSFPVKR